MPQNALLFLPIYILISFFAAAPGSAGAGEPPASSASIGPFSSQDASLHQKWIQDKLDAAGESPCTFIFAPGDYVITDPKGLRLPGGATLIMQGARFILSQAMKSDGQCFLVENISNISFSGGEVIGQRNSWEPGTNIAGIRMLGHVDNARASEMTFKDLSSNAIGVFGENDENPIRDIKLTNIVAINCCNYYGDYLQPDSGPARGSDRKDQGTAAFYHVDGWLVDGCRFEGSQSDGTHFYHCLNGIFVNNVVADSKMGGYFLEGCQGVLASENLILRSGSRGATIERDSLYCTLENNRIAFSGREGLWAPDVQGIIVASNIFQENGQKDDGEKDCEIRIDNTSDYAVDTQDMLITGNIFYTNERQTAAIFISEGVKDILIETNMFRGPAPEQRTAQTKP
ncbi:MAG: right-handed parallel beta-helix repeat-containing protein [Candidatus Omnitrophica bacterium]|nr:right-handed parallel beta-helix repeat-containing protein [Candidatus Omnitrophota bacterium]